MARDTKATAKLRARHPGYVERIEFAAEAEARQDQRRRNMRLLGLH